MPLTYAARHVFPVGSAPIPGGTLTVLGSTILRVARRRGDAVDRDLGNVALLPGLVNTHTHLEFSHLSEPLGRAGMPLHVWLKRVINSRRETNEQSVSGPAASTARGMDEAFRSGTTRLADIVASSTAWPAPEKRPAIEQLIELRGISADRIEAAHQLLSQLLSCRIPTLVSTGVSPHAPYSVHPELVQYTADWAARHHATIAMHLAESPDERELLAQGRGPLRVLLEDLGVWQPGVFNGGLSFEHYLNWLSKAPRSLVVHGNYLRCSDWDFLAAHRHCMTLVYCSRTHSYFGHPPYPLAELQRRNVRVALGTDSRASNPDLSLWNEWRAVAAKHTDVPPEKILAMATCHGARALGAGDSEGILRAGYRANIVAVELPDRTAADPHELLLDPQAVVAGVMMRGKWIVSTERFAENLQGR
jgi:cytosine/adenosine deaminase-related metal-dependent hydrolase